MPAADPRADDPADRRTGDPGDPGDLPAPGDEGSPPPGGSAEGTPLEAVADVVGEIATGPPPPWSRRTTARLHGFDDAVDALVEAHLRGRPVVDRAMYSLTELADFSLLWHLLAATRGVRSDRHALEAVRLSAVLGVESTVVNGVLKSLFKRQRPVTEAARPHHLRVPLTTSFPSGHSSAAFCAATLLGEGRPLATRAAWYALAGAVATSRVHVRIHHASDVVGGAAVGLLVAAVARRVWPRP